MLKSIKRSDANHPKTTQPLSYKRHLSRFECFRAGYHHLFLDRQPANVPISFPWRRLETDRLKSLARRPNRYRHGVLLYPLPELDSLIPRSASASTVFLSAGPGMSPALKTCTLGGPRRLAIASAITLRQALSWQKNRIFFFHPAL
jgi:hypothetical protein